MKKFSIYLKVKPPSSGRLLPAVLDRGVVNWLRQSTEKLNRFYDPE